MKDDRKKVVAKLETEELEKRSAPLTIAGDSAQVEGSTDEMTLRPESPEQDGREPLEDRIQD